MNLILIITTITLCLCLLWRWVCNYKSIPWPHWLAFWLHNPYMKIFASPRHVLDQLNLRSDMRVLEIGCGAGRILQPIAQQVDGRVVGLDMQDKMLKKLSDPKIEKVHGPFSADLFPNTTFDLILLVTVLGELPNRQEIFSFARRALAPKGRLLIAEVIPDPCYVRRGVVRRMAQRAGLTEIKSHTNGIMYTAQFASETSSFT